MQNDEGNGKIFEELIYGEFCEAVENFFRKKEEFDAAKHSLESSKDSFYGDMGFYFDKLGIDSKITIDLDDRRELTVRKICKSKVEFDPSKTEKALGKQYGKDVISKSYTINDIDGLIAYLKSCGVDPKVFKSFLNIEKKVNVEELERLEELGKISKAQLDGCFEVKNQKPYYTVTLSKGQRNEC